jgi:membrane-associated phospholipid phosphatase
MNDAIFAFLYGFSFRHPWLDRVIIFFASYFPYLVIFGAVIFLLFHHEVFRKEHPFRELFTRWKEIGIALLSGIIAWISAHILKILIHSARPSSMLFSKTQALFLADGYAFPSGHAAFFFALAQSIFFFHKKAGYVFFACALIISIARVMAGVHSPIDILGGFVLGVAVAYLFRKI